MSYWKWLIGGSSRTIYIFLKHDLVARYGFYAMLVCILELYLFDMFIPFDYAPSLIVIVFVTLFLIMGYGAYKERNPVNR